MYLLKQFKSIEIPIGNWIQWQKEYKRFDYQHTLDDIGL